MLRLILISATLFSTFMSLKYPTIFLDVQTFNLIFIVLNGYFSFNLMMKLVPPKFTTEETRMYNKYFFRYFKPHEFRKLMDSARRRVYKVNTNVVNQGNSFSSLFFVADIVGENVSLDLKSNGVHIKYLNVYGWLGIVEYIEVISSGTIAQAISRGSDFGAWGVSLDVCFHIGEEQNESGTEEEFTGGSNISQEEEEDYFECDLKEIHKEVVVYEFDLEVSKV
jgi:hypothetical protein